MSLHDNDPPTEFFSREEILRELERINAQSSDKRREIKDRIMPRIHDNQDLKRLDLEAADDNLKERELRKRTEDIVRAELACMDIHVPQGEMEHLIQEILDEALGLGPLEPLLRDPSINEIMVNGPDCIFVDRVGEGVVLTNHSFTSEQQLFNVIERIVAPIGRRIDESSPYVDARLIRDGSRVHIIIPPLAISGATITIRKFPEPFKAADLMAKGSFSQRMLTFLTNCVVGRRSIIVSGGTGSGKTTLLNVLSQFIPDNERIITFEVSADLQLRHVNLVRLESRGTNVEGKGAVSIRDLVRNTLRMRPDRIVVGECRGAEAFDMMQAMNTGHEGSMTTIHANTPKDMLARLEDLIRLASDVPSPLVQRNIASAVDLVVQITRMRDGSRKIVRISEVIQSATEGVAIEDIYIFEEQGVDDEGRTQGFFKATGYVPSFVKALTVRGIPCPDSLFDSETEEHIHVDEKDESEEPPQLSVAENPPKLSIREKPPELPASEAPEALPAYEKGDKTLGDTLNSRTVT